MDPVTLLVSTLALGATAALKDTAGEAVKDGYAGLKSLIVKKFGPKPAVDALEQKPESANKRESAAEDLADAAVDEEVVAAAADLAKAVQRHDPMMGAIFGISIDDVVAQFLDVDGVRSSASGVLVNKSKFKGGLTIKNVVAGSDDPSRP